MPKLKEPKTHFEQVPPEIFKKIAEEEIQALGSATVSALVRPSHGRRDGALKLENVKRD